MVAHNWLLVAAQTLSKRYREESRVQFIKTDDERKAYSAFRRPATAAVLKRLFAMLPNHYKSLLDLGAGPATSFLAGEGVFETFTCMEKDEGFVRELQKNPQIEVLAGDFTILPFPQRDVALFSYSLGEIGNPEEVVLKAYSACKAIMIVEPGTPRGFGVIKQARELLIQEGASILAPCPHALTCPMQGENWCHFAERLERSREHRLLKEATLSYEDEKYSYIIASKEPPSQAVSARILRHPLKRKGHLSFTLCTEEGECRERIVSKKEGDVYKRARKKAWGDMIN